jgi:hypothetical protein
LFFRSIHILDDLNPQNDAQDSVFNDNITIWPCQRASPAQSALYSNNYALKDDNDSRLTEPVILSEAKDLYISIGTTWIRSVNTRPRFGRSLPPWNI